MFLYLLKSTACLGLFLLFYWAVLENARMHLIKRFYLLIALVLSLVVPLITFTTYIEIEPVDYSFDTSYVSSTIAPNENRAIEYWPIVLWTIYGLGVAIFTFKFISNLLTLSTNITTNTKFKMGSIINVLLKQQVVPHTFFNYIFLNRRKFENNEIPREVLLHEIAHARQKHSIDIIVVELLQIVFWFNPLFYLTKRVMKLNHEFLADQAVIGAGIATSRYQNTLLDFASSARANRYQPSMANAIDFSFYSSIRLALFGKSFPFRKTVAGQVKKRFTVMRKRTSKKSIVLRSTLIIPLLAFMVFALSTTKLVPVEPSSTVIRANPSPETEQTTRPSGEIKTLKPTPNDFEKWKNGDIYAVWIHEKHIGNSVLNRYSPADFAHFSQSYIEENARSAILPQPYQIRLYTQEEFEKFSVPNDRFITIHINSNGNLLVQNKVVAIDDLPSFLENRNSDLTKEERANTVQAIIKPYNIAPNSDLVLQIENILEGYGVARIDIVGSEISSFGDEKQQTGATIAQLREYNILAKKYNAVPKAKRTIPFDDLKSLERIYRKMSEEQRGEALPFPECQDPKSDGQKRATAKQVAEYNALAKKYNAMLEGEVIRIMKTDVDRLEYLYALMSAEQRSNAEAFPEFPEPPEPPTPPAPPVSEDIEIDEIIEIPEHEVMEIEEEVEVEEEVDEIIEIPKNEALHEEVIHEIVENQEIYDHLDKNIKVSMINRPSLISKEAKQLRRMVSRYDVDTEEIKSTRQENIPPPPPPYKIPEPRKDYSQALLKAFDDFNSSGRAYGKAISQFMKNNKGNRSDLWAMHDQVIEKYNLYVALAVEEGLMPRPIKKPLSSMRRKQNIPPPPPPAPEPKSPLEHIEEMAAEGALFYYQGKAIKAEKAKKILRENNNINIDTRHEKGQRPVIELSTNQ